MQFHYAHFYPFPIALAHPCILVYRNTGPKNTHTIHTRFAFPTLSDERAVLMRNLERERFFAASDGRDCPRGGRNAIMEHQA